MTLDQAKFWLELASVLVLPGVAYLLGKVHRHDRRLDVHQERIENLHDRLGFTPPNGFRVPPREGG
jgi:hypothetical protein